MVAIGLWATTLIACERPAEWDSVLVIVVDTLRADHLGVYGYGRATSPAIDRRSAQAAVFETAMATAPWTLPTFGTLFTGELPSRHRAGFNEALGGEPVYTAIAADVPTLAELLADGGIATGAVMNNPFLDPRFGLARGFETYDYLAGNNRTIRRADRVVDAALQWLDARGRRPFFLVVHLFDPHLDYDAPAPFRGRFTGDPEDPAYSGMRLAEIRQRVRRGERVDFEFLSAAYDEEIAFVDAEIGRLLDVLEQRGIADRTLIMLTADHGEEFLDHGGFEHGHSMFQELVRVPLLVWGPGVEPRRIAEPVSLIDLPPTVLDGLGVEGGQDLPGVSLVSVLRGASVPGPRTLVAEVPKYGPERTALVEWPLKFVRTAGQDDRLFDLHADPGEREDLARERPRDVAVLGLAVEELGNAAATLTDGEPVDLAPETIRQLRALGYIR